MDTRRSLVFALATLALPPLSSVGVGCSEPVLAKPPSVADADDQVATCKIARDPLNPLIVEWPGTSKVELDSTSRRGIVVVSYLGCNLKVLSNCRAEGAYAFTGVTPARDSIKVSSVTDLYARLPLGAASLKGELSNGSTLELDYIAVGLRRSDSAPERLTGECSGATHYVDRMTLGAYSLDALASGSVSGGVDIQGAGIGGGRREGARRLRGSGELSRCDGKAPDGEADVASSGCGAILQIGLSPLPEAVRPSPAVVPPKEDVAVKPAPPLPVREDPRSRGEDRDGDGLSDAVDQCPDEPEDKDGFADDDGCPDPDNDRDGVLDVNDKCPNAPETKNGFMDDDGCPDERVRSLLPQ